MGETNKITKEEINLYKKIKENDLDMFKILRELYKEKGISQGIEKDEIAELEKIVLKSPELQKMLKDYEQLRSRLDSKQEENARNFIASKLYEVMGGKEGKTYFDVEDISVYIPKLNLGLIRTPSRSFNERDYRGGVEQLLYLIEDDNEAAKVLTRVYSKEIEKKKDPIEAREFLKKLKDGK